jgi:hypothetical protein
VVSLTPLLDVYGETRIAGGREEATGVERHVRFVGFEKGRLF